MNYFSKTGRRKKPTSDIVTDEELEKCYEKMAYIVSKYGDVYLPIFKRLHEEREMRRQNNDLKSIAVRIAQSSQKPP